MSQLLVGSLSRRTLLKHSAKGATLGALVSALGFAATADMKQHKGIVGSACVTLLYKNGPDVKFDHDYFRDHHIKLVMDRLGSDAISRFEFRKPLVPQGAAAPTYVAVVNIWIKDAEKLAAASAKHTAELAADGHNYTNAALVAQNEIVWGEAGADVHVPGIGDFCTTLLYPYKEGARWDGDYYRDHHMPLIMQLLGSDAIKRFEVRKAAVATNGARPGFFGTVGIYVNDQQKFAAAAAINSQEMNKDVANFSSQAPLGLQTEIYGLHV